MKLRIFTALLALLVVEVHGQSGLNSFLSEVYSIYTEVTSILASDAATQSTTSTSSLTTTSSTPTSFSTVTSTSTSSVFPVSTSSSTTSSTSSTISVTSTPSPSTSPTVAATSATAVPVTNNDPHHSNTLAIVLGAVLGALALGFLILALILCCRRRHTRRATRVPVEDDEVDGWRLHGGSYNGITSRQISDQHLAGVGGPAVAAAPLMAEHPAYRNQPENPFRDPPRRSAPNSRPGLTDESRPADLPYFVEKESGRPVSLARSSDGHGVRDAAAGAAFGAAAMHHHDNHSHPDNPFNEKQPHIYSHIPSPEQRKRSESLGRANTKEAWPYGGVSHEQDTTPPPRISDESHRRSSSRDAARANAAFNSAYAAPNNPYQSYPDPSASSYHSAEMASPITNRQPHDSLMAGAAGFGAGAIAGGAMAHHNNQHSQGIPQRRHSRNLSGLHELPVTEDIPPAPLQPRSRRNSPLGSAAPGSARESYQNRPRSDSYQNRGPTLPPLVTHLPGRQRDQTPPNLPSRSPRRASQFNDSPTVINSEPPRRENMQSPVSPLNPGEGVDTFPTSPHPLRGIVGDNGYPQMPPHGNGNNMGYTHPHIGFSQRNKNTPYQTTDDPNNPTDFVHHLHGTPNSLRPQTHPNTGSYNNSSSSDESTWRLSSGMPGGWARTSPRNSLDSAVAVGRKESPLAANSGRRLRLADLRKEEEQKMREEQEMRGRRSMEAGAYQGAQRYPSVGKAL